MLSRVITSNPWRSVCLQVIPTLKPWRRWPSPLCMTPKCRHTFLSLFPRPSASPCYLSSLPSSIPTHIQMFKIPSTASWQAHQPGHVHRHLKVSSIRDYPFFRHSNSGFFDEWSAMSQSNPVSNIEGSPVQAWTHGIWVDQLVDDALNTSASKVYLPWCPYVFKSLIIQFPLQYTRSALLATHACGAWVYPMWGSSRTLHM